MGKSETLATFVIVFPVGIWGRRFTVVAVEVGVTVGVGWGSGWLCAVGVRRGGTEAVAAVQAQVVVEQLVVEKLAERGPTVQPAAAPANAASKAPATAPSTVPPGPATMPRPAPNCKPMRAPTRALTQADEPLASAPARPPMVTAAFRARLRLTTRSLRQRGQAGITAWRACSVGGNRSIRARGESAGSRGRPTGRRWRTQSAFRGTMA